MHTRLTDVLGIEHPVMLAGMGGVSYSALVAAVSEAGGFGCFGASTMSGDEMVAEIRAAKAMTDKPLGVDLLTAMPDRLMSDVEALIHRFAAEHDDLDERTVLATRSKQRAVLQLPTGGQSVLTESVVIIGRAPTALDTQTDTQLIAVDEPTRTISKTLAMLERTGGGWTIRDLGSTNGVFIIDENGTEQEASATTRVTGAFLLGDAKFELNA